MLTSSIRRVRVFTRFSALLGLIWLSIATVPAAAADTEELMKPCLGATATFTPGDSDKPVYAAPEKSSFVTWENDAIAAFSGSDESYTQGMQFGYRFDPRHMPKWLAEGAAHFCRAIQEHSNTDNKRLVGSASLFIGQHMFTPHSISIPELIEDDRPYAAWLYAGGRLEVFQSFDGGHRAGDGIYHLFELQLGITGRRAQGEFIQTNFHKLISDELPQGWDNQIPTEVGLFLKYQGSMRVLARDLSVVPISMDVVPSWQMGLGNIQTYAQAGGVIRFGRNMTGTGAGVLTPTAENPKAPASSSGGYARCIDGPLILGLDECYLFVGANARVVGYNAFVQGTLFHDSHGVSKEPFVYDLTWGLRLRGPKMQIDYAFIRRSKEFSPVAFGAEERSGRHDYGALTVTCLQDWTSACPTFVATVLAAIFIQK